MKKILTKVILIYIKLVEKKQLKKCYISIDDLPVFYWRKIQETNNLSFLIKSDIITLNKKQPSKVQMIILSKLWKNIFDEYLKMFGFAENFIEIFRKINERETWRCRMIIENNKAHKNFINMCDIELEAMKKANNEGINFYETKAFIESEMHIQVDEMKTSVAQFYSYIKLAQSKQANGRGTN